MASYKYFKYYLGSRSTNLMPCPEYPARGNWGYSGYGIKFVDPRVYFKSKYFNFFIWNSSYVVVSTFFVVTVYIAFSSFILKGTRLELLTIVGRAGLL